MPVELEITGGIALVTLRRPRSANALNSDLLNRLHRLQRQLGEDKQARVVITMGEGKGFCAGSDLKELAGFSPQQSERAQRLEARVCRGFLRLPQPTIACVHGYALGGGLCVAIHHDFQVVAADARLGLPEVKLGWNPSFGIQRLCQLVGVGVATRWVMQADEFSAAEGAAAGCITQVVPAGGDVLAACRNLAEKLMEIPPAALAAAKQALWSSYGRQTVGSDSREAVLYRKCLAALQSKPAAARGREPRPEKARKQS